MTNPKMEINAGGLRFNNPVLTAAGPVGFGSSYSDFFSLDILGGLVLRTLTYKPRIGSDPPRLWETHSGVMNNIGFQNPGLELFKKKFYPNLAKLSTNLIASIYGDDLNEYKVLAGELNSLPEIKAVEINLYISLQHYREIGLSGYLNWAKQVVCTVKESSNLPVWVKLSPNVGDIEEAARIAEREGADAITVANSFWAMALDPETGKSRLGSLIGGLSGAAIKPLALRMVWQISQAVDIPVIGVGGILTPDDAVEYMMAGASLIGIGSGNFVDPLIVKKVIDGLKDYLKEHNIDDIRKLIKKAAAL